jgi:hypothetical protein
MLAWSEQMASAVRAATEANGVLARLNANGESLAKRVEAEVTGGARVRFLSERLDGC